MLLVVALGAKADIATCIGCSIRKSIGYSFVVLLKPDLGLMRLRIHSKWTLSTPYSTPVHPPHLRPTQRRLLLLTALPRSHLTPLWAWLARSPYPLLRRNILLVGGQCVRGQLRLLLACYWSVPLIWDQHVWGQPHLLIFQGWSILQGWHTRDWIFSSSDSETSLVNMSHLSNSAIGLFSSYEANAVVYELYIPPHYTAWWLTRVQQSVEYEVGVKKI